MTTSITVKFTPEELKILCSLASDQLFRREFIDPSFPGHKSNSGDLRLGKQLLERLRSVTPRANGAPMANAARASA